MSGAIVRKARIGDIKDIMKVVNFYAGRGEMLHRSLIELHENLRDFFVCEIDGRIVGTAALRLSWEKMAEIRSLAVASGDTGKGVGRRLVAACLVDAGELGVDKVFALTYQPDFFRKLGFSELDKHQLPQKIWGDCVKCVKFPDCDEVALAINL